jgi:hypothetical protein
MLRKTKTGLNTRQKIKSGVVTPFFNFLKQTRNMTIKKLTPELYEKLKQENYKYLVYKRTKENKEQGVYQPVKDLPNHFVISMDSMEDEKIISSVSSTAGNLLIEY